jgi:protein involved in polysaccharide export with SLBB domain
VRIASSLLIAAACLGIAFAPGSVSGQSQESRLSQATREQIQVSLAEAEKIIASSGYSGRIKDAKRKEIALLRSRIEDGDLQPGDQVILVVMGESTLTGNFTVGPARTLALPGIPDISLKGLLRSEIPDFLTNELKKYLRNPTVQAQVTLRLSFLGGIGRPGYYQMPAQALIDSAIMAAGGPAGGIDPADTKIERSGKEILSKEGFRQALIEGRTLDQLNLRAGDEIIVGGSRTSGQRTGGFLRNTLPYVGAISSLTYLLTRLLRI